MWLEPSWGYIGPTNSKQRVAVTTLTARRSVLLSPLLLSTSTTPSTRDPVDGPPAGVRVAWTLLQKRTWFPQLALRWRRETKTLRAKPR
eukprot:scaffold5774_cov67-Phaeocystis_antarctica.AAC.4